MYSCLHVSVCSGFCLNPSSKWMLGAVGSKYPCLKHASMYHPFIRPCMHVWMHSCIHLFMSLPIHTFDVDALCLKGVVTVITRGTCSSRTRGDVGCFCSFCVKTKHIDERVKAPLPRACVLFRYPCTHLHICSDFYLDPCCKWMLCGVGVQ